MPNIDAKTKLAVEKLLEVCEPKKIILFGSFARGEQNEHSDLDLLIVVEEVTDLIEETARLRKALDCLDMAIDIALTSEDRYQTRKNSFGHLYFTADKEGKVLYDEAA